MTLHAISILDVLTPPPNQWLKSLSTRNAVLPDGVRVVRFSEGNDDVDLSGDDVVTLKPRSKGAGIWKRHG